MLYLWVAGSSKVTRVGRCPLFVFQGSFLRHLVNGWSASATRRSAWRGATGWRVFDVQLRREVGGTVLRVIIDRPDPGVGHPRRADRRPTPAKQAAAGGGIGWHCRLPASQPGPERASSTSRRTISRPAQSATRTPWRFRRQDSIGPSARGGLPEISGTTGKGGDERAGRWSVGVCRTAGGRGRRPPAARGRPAGRIACR